MRSSMVVEVKVAAGAVEGIFRCNVVMQADLIFECPPETLGKDVVQRPPPLPSMLMRTSAASSRSMYCGLVKWLPWSLFQIVGLACANAASTATNTKSMSNVWSSSPTDHIARVPIQDGHQIQPLFL